jgi:hypothetical protein
MDTFVVRINKDLPLNVSNGLILAREVRRVFLKAGTQVQYILNEPHVFFQIMQFDINSES